MNTSLIDCSSLKKDHSYFYDHEGVKVDLTQDVPVISYRSHGHQICRQLKPGGPAGGIGEVVEEDGLLHIFYDKPLKSWIIVHSLPPHKEVNEEEWFDNTIYIPDESDALVKKGYSPASPKTIWPHFIELGFVIQAVAIGLWIAAIYNYAHPNYPRAEHFATYMGTGLALLGLAILAFYHKSPGPDR